LLIYFDYDVSFTHSGLFRRAPGNHIGDNGSIGIRCVEVVGKFFVNRLQIDTDIGLDDLTVIYQFIKNFVNGCHGNSKPNPLGRGVDCGINSNYLAGCIEKGTPAVTGIDGSICLQEVFEHAVRYLYRASLGTDNPNRNGMVKTVGISDGDYPAADFGFIGITQFQNRQFLVDRYLEHCQVQFLVRPDHLGT